MSKSESPGPSTKPSTSQASEKFSGYVRIPAGDLTLEEAAAATDDKGAWFWSTLPAVLQHFPQYTARTYWGELTVAEHALLVKWLEDQGTIERSGRGG